MKKIDFISRIVIIAMAIMIGVQIASAQKPAKTPSKPATATPTPKPTPKPAASPKPKPTTTPKTPTTPAVKPVSVPAPAAKPLTQSDVVGNYQASPVQNEWNVGRIEAKPNSEGKLKWTNRAGVSWTLAPDYKTGVLKTTDDNPYQKDGPRDFTLVVKDGQVTGFMFGGGLYARPSAVKATKEMVVGNYLGSDPKNDWHIGKIEAIPDGRLKWTNKAGASWTLTPDYANGLLKTGDDNPYQKDGPRDFTLVIDQGKVGGFFFGGLFTRSN